MQVRFDRASFDHIGLVTDEQKAGESWVEATRVWVTSPREHPHNIEWLRFEPDTPVTGPLRTEPHVAYRVPDVNAAIEGHAVRSGPVDVDDGELVCVLGPSGCGKTTLLWAMSGLHGRTGGRIMIGGSAVTGPRPAEIGMIFQDANLLPWRNLRQNLEFPFEIKHRKPD